MKQHNIEGFVKISGSDLKTKAGALLTHLQHLNEQLFAQDEINKAEFDENRTTKILELNEYRDSGKAWRDYSVALARTTTYEPITWFGFLKVGEKAIVHRWDLGRALELISPEFWRELFYQDLENLTAEQLSKFSNYDLPYYPTVTRKYDLKFLEELMLLVSEPEIYLSITDYHKLTRLWVEHFVGEDQELLVG